MNDRNHRIVAMIGSLRFKARHDEIVERLLLMGDVPIPLIQIQSKYYAPDDIKSIADCHIRKVIDIADAVYCINQEGYMGTSTIGEIKYALQSNKPVVCIENPWTYDSYRIIRHYVNGDDDDDETIAIMSGNSHDEVTTIYRKSHTGITDDTRYTIIADRHKPSFVGNLKFLSTSYQSYDDAQKSLSGPALPEPQKLECVEHINPEEYVKILEKTIPQLLNNLTLDQKSFNMLSAIHHILNLGV